MPKPDAGSYPVQFHKIFGLSSLIPLKRHKIKQWWFFFLLVLFFCTKNTQWVLGLEGEERLRC